MEVTADRVEIRHVPGQHSTHSDEKFPREDKPGILECFVGVSRWCNRFGLRRLVLLMIPIDCLSPPTKLIEEALDEVCCCRTARKNIARSSHVIDFTSVDVSRNARNRFIVQ